jgi:hypothetical protein
MEKRINVFEIFKNEGRLSTLYVYQSREVENDPYEHTKTLTYYNPLPIKGLIRQVSAEALHWKYWGLLPQGSIEVIAEKKYLTLFRTADKIKYNDNYYKCWKDDNQNFVIIERPDYVVVILAKR